MPSPGLQGPWRFVCEHWACPKCESLMDRFTPPLIWLLGKTQAGKTSIVAEITGEAVDQVGCGFVPVTKHSSIYVFPRDRPIIRFLDTRGLGDVEGYDPSSDLSAAKAQAHLLMVVVRAEDLSLGEILPIVLATRKQHPDWPVVVAQTCLHHCYGRNAQHVWPYPFTGDAADRTVKGVSEELRQALMAQRKLFADLHGRAPVFVPLDFTTPDHGLPPCNYGADLLWDALEQEIPNTMVRLPRTADLRRKVILPWAIAAASANAVPLPVLGGLGSASAQAMMVRQIGQRLGYDVGIDLWREFCSTLGSGFILGFGGSWLAQQVLKLAPVAGSAAVASWTFAVTWGIGEAALYYFQSKQAGRTPEHAELIAVYKESLRKARDQYKAWRAEKSAAARQ